MRPPIYDISESEFAPSKYTVGRGRPNENTACVPDGKGSIYVDADNGDLWKYDGVNWAKTSNMDRLIAP